MCPGNRYATSCRDDRRSRPVLPVTAAPLFLPDDLLLGGLHPLAHPRLTCAELRREPHAAGSIMHGQRTPPTAASMTEVSPMPLLPASARIRPACSRFHSAPSSETSCPCHAHLRSRWDSGVPPRPVGNRAPSKGGRCPASGHTTPSEPRRTSGRPPRGSAPPSGASPGACLQTAGARTCRQARAPAPCRAALADVQQARLAPCPEPVDARRRRDDLAAVGLIEVLPP